MTAVPPPTEAWPEPVADLLAGATLDAVAGTSDATVHRVTQAGEVTAYLKVAAPIGPGAGAELLAAEHDRLGELGPWVPVPHVLAWVPDTGGGRAHLLTAALPGTPATADEHRGDVEALIRGLATGLRRLHDLDPAVVGPTPSLDDRLAVAAERVARDLVDRADFEPAYARYRPDELYDLLLRSRPPDPPSSDLVIVHGDYSLGNVLLEHGEVVGYLDVGRAGVGDRYLDLAVAARSLAHHVSPEALGPFFDAYGIDFPDLARIDFYVLLDEFC